MSSNAILDDDACKGLKHATLHASINTCLLVALVIANSLKLYRSVKDHYIRSLSFWYLFFGLLFNISQLCMGIISTVDLLPQKDCAYHGPGLLTFILLLLLSAVILISSFIMYTIASNSCSPDAWQQRQPLFTPANPTANPNREARSLKPVLPHAVLVLYLLLLLFTLTLPIIRDRFLGLFVLYTVYFHLIILPVLTFGQFVPQFYLLWRRQQDLGRTLELDTVCFAVDSMLSILVGLSWRWYIYETKPYLLDFWYALTHPLSWETSVNWLWVNNLVVGLGTGLIPVVYAWLRVRAVVGEEDRGARTGVAEGEQNGDREPLLQAEG